MLSFHTPKGGKEKEKSSIISGTKGLRKQFSPFPRRKLSDLGKEITLIWFRAVQRKKKKSNRL